jgi:hypothetical protein
MHFSVIKAQLNNVKTNFISVFTEAQSRKYCEVEGSYQREWSVVLCVWVYEGESLSNDEGQVSLLVINVSSKMRSVSSRQPRCAERNGLAWQWESSFIGYFPTVIIYMS